MHKLRFSIASFFQKYHDLRYTSAALHILTLKSGLLYVLPVEKNLISLHVLCLHEMHCKFDESHISLTIKTMIILGGIMKKSETEIFEATPRWKILLAMYLNIY